MSCRPRDLLPQGEKVPVVVGLSCIDVRLPLPVRERVARREPRRVRGFFERYAYCLQHALFVLPEVRIPKSHDAEASTFEKRGAVRIDCLILGLRVLATVQFDDEPTFEAHEIDDIGASRLLTAKFLRVKTAITQDVPQLAFEVRLSVPQFSCKIVLHCTPHPAQPRNKSGSAPPSPARGEGFVRVRSTVMARCRVSLSGL